MSLWPSITTVEVFKKRALMHKQVYHRNYTHETLILMVGEFETMLYKVVFMFIKDIGQVNDLNVRKSKSQETVSLFNVIHESFPLLHNNKSFKVHGFLQIIIGNCKTFPVKYFWFFENSMLRLRTL